MAKLSLPELHTLLASYVDISKIGVVGFTATSANSGNLVDKIGRQITLDTSFIDPLTEMDGTNLPYGKTIEEWYQDLILPQAFDEEGSGAMTLHKATYRKASYSYTLGRKYFATSKRYDDLERACNSDAEYISMIEEITKRLYDSYAVWKFGAKRELLDKMAKKAVDVSDASTATAFSASGSYTVNTIVKNSDGSKVGIVVKDYNNSASGYDEAVTAGYIVVYDLVTTIAKPVDTATGEAFIKQVKKDVEAFQWPTEGHSFNGNTIGAVDGLILYVVKGVLPSLDVDTMAGAFHLDKLAVPCQIKVVPDFGDDESGCYAILMDSRGAKVHEGYRAVRTNENGEGDFINYFLHTENTAFMSLNTALKVYKAE